MAFIFDSILINYLRISDTYLIEYKREVTSCHSSVKLRRQSLKIGTRGIFGSRRSNMTPVFKIDRVFINYLYMMTFGHLRVKQCQNSPKIGTQDIFGSRRSNMTSVVKIDQVLVNYLCMMTYGHLRVKRGKGPNIA